jgi:hypothetical protein
VYCIIFAVCRIRNLSVRNSMQNVTSCAWISYLILCVE